MNKRIEEAINQQINKEFFSAYLYLSMVNYFEENSLKGFANWMKVQYEEELVHAHKFISYLHERGGKVEFDAIAKPNNNWESPLSIFETAYKHETFISSSINEILTIAIEEKDHATVNFLQWFVSEQVEEEANASEIVTRLKMAGDEKSAIFMLDLEFSKRALNTTNN